MLFVGRPATLRGMRRSYLCHCAPGDVLDDVYVITGKQLSATTTGKYFIKAFISDRTMQITARMWNATRDIFNALPEAGFLKVRGRVENYQNNLQFIIEQTWPAKEDTYDMADLVPHTTRDIPKMYARLVEILGSIQNRHLSALVHAYLDDQRLMGQFCKAPAAMSFHHAFLGGLLEHTSNSVEVADAICRFYPGLNRDIVIAGIFLHDIAKTWELTYECAFGYSDGGQLVGHIVKSAIWVEHKRRKAEEMLGEPIPQRLIDVIQHIIISHHGVPEFGAIKPPSTPEAIAVHYIENLDAKLVMSLQATRGEAGPGSEGNWTEYMKAFGGRLYRPDVAPADVPEETMPDGEVAADIKPPELPATSTRTAAKSQGKPSPALSNPLFEINGAPAAPKR